MTFNSLSFAVFFAATYAIYLLLRNRLTLQNRWLLAASCFFYGWWDWRFLFLMAATIAIDFFAARGIRRSATPVARKFLLVLSLGSNLAVLAFFKYFYFLTDSLGRMLKIFGFSFPEPTLNILLPIGISFYTFQAMSYVIDVYRRELEPAENFLDYAAFITYFPQLVAGPIERGTHLLPQILSPRTISTAGFYEGCYLIFWGLFQKVFVADNLARIADSVFAAPAAYGSFSVLIAVYAFAFQIYCDFSGYSDIARGLGKCMGFDILVNFNLPYFSTHAREFWQRWHISLSTWFRDYVYIPLGGNKHGRLSTLRNLTLTMVLAGLWHGAKWTFVFWGAYHGLLLILDRVAAPFFSAFSRFKSRTLQNLWFLARVIFFFHLVCFGWILFRAQSVSKMMEVLKTLFHVQSAGNGQSGRLLASLVFFSAVFLFVQCRQYIKDDALTMFRLPQPARWAFYYVMLFSMLFFGGPGVQFIYFQF